MGAEFAHFREWDESRGLDWMLLDFPAHRKYKEYIRALNHLYRKEKCLSERECGYDGFAGFPQTTAATASMRTGA